MIRYIFVCNECKAEKVMCNDKTLPVKWSDVINKPVNASNPNVEWPYHKHYCPKCSKKKGLR